MQPNQTTFAHYLLSGTLVHECNFESLQEQLQIDVHPTLVMLISVDRYPEQITTKPFIWRQELGRQVTLSITKTIRYPFVSCWSEEGVLALLVELPIEGVAKTTRTLATRIQSTLKYEGISVSIGIGRFEQDPYALYLSYQEAKKAMIDRFFQGNQLIFIYSAKEMEEGPWKDPISEEDQMELEALVRIRDEAGVINHFTRLLEQLTTVYQHEVEIFKAEAANLILRITRIALQSTDDSSAVLLDNAQFMQKLYKIIRYDHFMDECSNHIRQLIQQMEPLQKVKASPLVKRAIRYITSHHTQKINLEEVSEVCSVSVYYFSHMFKKETGMSFVDYLNQLRIYKSISYLENTELTIQEIAYRVGLDDANYYSRLFKKYKNITPSKYRKAKLCDHPTKITRGSESAFI